MLQKVKDYVTWGEGTPENVALLIRRRGEFVGGIRVTDEELAGRSQFKSVDDLAVSLCAGDIGLKDVEGLEPLFRLHPPRGGFRGSRKKAFVAGGEAGYRGEVIADLLSSMV
jgi:large subunit ribosomal protein L30